MQLLLYKRMLSSSWASFLRHRYSKSSNTKKLLSKTARYAVDNGAFYGALGSIKHPSQHSISIRIHDVELLATLKQTLGYASNLLYCACLRTTNMKRDYDCKKEETFLDACMTFSVPNTVP